MAVVTIRSHVAPRTYKMSPATIIAAHKRTYGAPNVRDLTTVLAVFKLSPREAGKLFGVTRQAVNQWLESGVPAERAASIAHVADVARRLRLIVKPERIPAFITRSNPGLGGDSVLDVLRAGASNKVMAALDRLESWVPAASEE